MEFWIGLLLAIPLSILANLLTPQVQLWYDTYNQKRALLRTKNMQTEYKTALKYHDNPHELSHYLIFVAIQTTFVGSLVAVLAGIAAIAAVTPQFLGYMDWLDPYTPRVLIPIVSLAMSAIAQFLSMMGALIIINICRSAFAMWYKVKNFENYQASVRRFLGENI